MIRSAFLRKLSASLLALCMAVSASAVLAFADEEQPGDTTGLHEQQTDDETTAAETIKAVEAQLEKLSTKDIASRSWKDYGEVILADDLDEAVALVKCIMAAEAAKVPEAVKPVIREYENESKQK